MASRGEILKDALRDSGMKITEFATRMHRTRYAVYDWFEKDDLSLDVLIRAGKILKVDFSKQIKELREINPIVSEPEEDYKKKYIELQEKHIKLLEEHKQLESAYIQRMGLKKKHSTSQSH